MGNCVGAKGQKDSSELPPAGRTESANPSKDIQQNVQESGGKGIPKNSSSGLGTNQTPPLASSASNSQTIKQKANELRKKAIQYDMQGLIESLDSGQPPNATLVLHLENHKLPIVIDFSYFSGLKQLYLYQNLITSIENLSSLYNLRILNLGKNNIQKIENLGGLVYLQSLSLNRNKIDRIQNLEPLVSLKKLDLSHNYIKQIQGLDSLDKLQEIDFSYNGITIITNLHDVYSLKKLNLQSNPIESDKNSGAIKALRNRKIDFKLPAT